MRWRWRGGASDEWQLRAGLATSSDSAATGTGVARPPTIPGVSESQREQRWWIAFKRWAIGSLELGRDTLTVTHHQDPRQPARSHATRPCSAGSPSQRTAASGSPQSQGRTTGNAACGPPAGDNMVIPPHRAHSDTIGRLRGTPWRKWPPDRPDLAHRLTNAEAAPAAPNGGYRMPCPVGLTSADSEDCPPRYQIGRRFIWHRPPSSPGTAQDDTAPLGRAVPAHPCGEMPREHALSA
jgi:hypothetical protein